MSGKDRASNTQDIPVVAIGASAGGLEPLEQLFSAVGDDSGIAFVVVQHLSPDYRSMMDELLARKSNLPIRHIDAGLKLEANSVYLNRPNMYVELEGDEFRTARYGEMSGMPHLPIDRFFTSLAKRDADRTVAVVLSGSGSDGSLGAQVLHETGAAVLVQSVHEAAFSSMPKSVLMAGSVDRVLNACDMPGVFQDILTYGKKSVKVASTEQVAGIKSILSRLEQRHRVDFSNYKSTNVNRRILRRLHLRGYASLEEYDEVLAGSDTAVDELFHDMLIGVTEFYRDKDAITTLRKEVLDALAAQDGDDAPIKIWVPGCASGEEVYTLAIELTEAMRAAGSDRKFRIIGTDVHSGSIDIASRGVYPAEKLETVPKDLRSRYFSEQSGNYVIDPVLRQKIIFSVHNLINDPPFMNLDLVSCRNLLIYFNEEPQSSAISMFMFGLKPSGYLWLGGSETVGKFKASFEVINARWRIFRKSSVPETVAPRGLAQRRTDGRALDVANTTERQGAQPRRPFFAEVTTVRSREMLMRSYDRLLKTYAPSSILLTSNGAVLNWFGDADLFVDTMNNLADWTVQEIVHTDLHFAINVGVEKLRQGYFETHARRVTVNLPDLGAQDCLIEIETLDDAGQDWLLLAKLTLLTRDTPELESKDDAQETPIEAIAVVDQDVAILNGRIHNLERDLKLTEETLQHVTERLEASGEELQASNEELQASNEELQASNEELQSSNEELHAVNEELVSVSAEHERKIDLMSELNDSTEVVYRILNIGVIVIDEFHMIRRFSQLVERDFLLQEHDCNRALATVGPRLDFADLTEMAQKLAERPTPQVASGRYSGRDLTVEAHRVFLGPHGEKTPGCLLLFRWT